MSRARRASKPSCSDHRPPITWIANDKALFTELVNIVLGPG